MKTAAKKRYGFMAVLLCILILMSAIVPVMSVLKDYQVYAAEGDITIYFDTSCTGKSGTESKWKKVPGSGDKIYCYTFKSASSSGFVEMTAVPGKVGSDGGRLYKCTVNRNDYSYLVISCENSWNNKINYTMDFQLSNVSENDILMLNSNGVDVGGGEYVQGMYVMGKYQVPIDYHNESVNTFSILNMDDTNVTLWIQYSTRTKNLEKDEWNPDVGDDQKNKAESVTISARNYMVNQFQVPVKKEGCEPWQTVTIYADNSGLKGQEIKKYYLPERKILGRSFFYGVTDFQNETSPLNYGSKLCYQTKNLSSVGSTNYELYFDKGFFPESTAYIPAYGSSSTSAVAVSKDGNAKFKTADNVTISAHNDITAVSGTVDLSASIMSVTYKGVQYNLFAPQTANDNLITVNDNVAVISGKYTVQSTGNIYKEGGKNYPYITTKADFYDYQYDKVENYKVDTGSGVTNKASQKGKAKRPYLFINEALSWSDYGQHTRYPLYLGQFWLPLNSGLGFGTSDNAYNSTTAAFQRSAHNDNTDTYKLEGQNDGYYMNFGFGQILNNFHWASNLAFRESGQPAGDYKPYDAVVQGLVADTLSSTDKKLMAPGGTYTVPYFDEDWWDDNEFVAKSSQNNPTMTITDTKKNYLSKYKELPFPFFETAAENISYKDGYSSDRMLSDNDDKYEGTYYVFDSRKHVIHVDNSGLAINSSNGQNLVYDNYGNGSTNHSEVGFFPFNTNYDNNSANLHYGFGMTFSIDFFLNENGTLDGTADGTPISFTFQGDDDVWVFLDDKLILDMGGAHKNAIGEINFRTKKTFIGAARTISDSNRDSVTVGKNEIPSITESFSDIGIGSEYLTPGKHKITMYYLERGMLNSNLYVMFNLPLSLTRFDLQNDTDFSGVNKGFENATKCVAENDVFNYSIQNRGTANVVGSEYKTPISDEKYRNNSETSQSTKLNNQTNTSTTVTPTGRIYFEPNAGWQNDNAKFAAWMWANNSKYAPVKWDSNVGKWYVDYDSNYSHGIKWLRINPSKYSDNEVKNADWNSLGLSDGRVWKESDNYNGSTSSASTSNITFTINGSGANDKSVSLSTTPKTYVSSGQHTYNFKGSASGSYVPMISNDSGTGVTYQLTEPNFAGDAVVTYDTRTVDENKGIVSMQYGEMATFSKQVTYGTSMKVKQLDTLSAPSGGSRASGYVDNTQRKASDYYITHYQEDKTAGTKYRRYAGIYRGDDVADEHLRHVNSMYSGVGSTLNNYSTNHVINPQVDNGALQFVFADPQEAGSSYVFLRQVVVNEIKTTDLRITKDIFAGENSTATFNFKIYFSNVFGKTDGDTKIDYSQISYTKHSGSTTTPDTLANNSTDTYGEFSLKKGEYIEIKDIPVMTKYYIEEDPPAGDHKLSSVYSVNLGSDSDKIQLKNSSTAIAMNKRDTGNIDLQKLVYDDNGTLVNGSDITAEFTVLLALIPEIGVDLSKYPIKFKQNGVNLVDANKVEDITATMQSSDPTIYPDRCKVFAIKIKANSAKNATALRLNVENIPYNTRYNVLERLEDVPAGYIKPGTIPSGSVWTESDYNCNISGTYSNVIFKDSKKKVDSTSNDLITVENMINPIVMPTTGGSGVIFIFPLGILAIVLSGAAVMIYKRKMDNGYIFGKGRYMK